MLLVFVGVVAFVVFRAWLGQEKLPFDPLSRYHSRNPEMKIPALEPTEATTLVMDVVLAVVCVVCSVTDWRAKSATPLRKRTSSVVAVTVVVFARLLLSVVLCTAEFDEGKRFDSCEDPSSTGVSGGYIAFLIGDFLFHLAALVYLLHWGVGAEKIKKSTESLKPLNRSSTSDGFAYRPGDDESDERTDKITEGRTKTERTQFVALDQVLWVYVGFALVLTVCRPTQVVFALWESACSDMEGVQIVMLLSTYLLLALTVWLLRYGTKSSGKNSALMIAVIPVIVIIVQPAYASQKSFSNVSKTILGILLYCSVLSNAVQ